jgi:hypothetical protein
MARVLYEHEAGTPIPEDIVDGTEELLGDDILDTNWDPEAGGIPPPGFWHGTHTRDGCRIPGFTEGEYQRGESWVMVRSGRKRRRTRCQKRKGTGGRPPC